MRLKDYSERDGKRVWLSNKELELFVDQAQDPRQDIAFNLGARSGLRRKEMLDLRFRDLTETDTGWVIRVWEGKGDKYREPPAPDTLVSTIRTLRYDHEPDDRVLGTEHGSTIYRWVSRAADRCRAATGDEGWQFLDVHDLRRSWGVQLLEAGVLPSVVMEWGGWSDWKTFRDHYLAEFSPEALRREREKAPWLRTGSTGDVETGSPGFNPRGSVSKTHFQNY